MSKNVLVIGSGGREHCIACKLQESIEVGKVYVSPGNGGTAKQDIDMKSKIVHVEDFPLDLSSSDVADWCISKNISLVVVGPEAPLADGLVDMLIHKGIDCFGPQKKAAEIESSKHFAKDFMLRHRIPTARYQVFSESKQACEFITQAPYPALVVKASGLAAGKGVVVAQSQDQACQASREILDDARFGSAGTTIIIEEMLEGEEFSVLAFTDGTHVKLMPPAQDHKQLEEGDTGPNTGGMGAYCPCPQVNKQMLATIEADILQKTVDGLREEGREFVGVLYAGLMLTRDGVKVLEFNCRFGDPECQVILPLLESDLYSIMSACVEGSLKDQIIHWKNQSYSVATVMVSNGYPGAYERGKIIKGINNAEQLEGVSVYESGTRFDANGETVTWGGRVLSVCAISSQLACCLGLVLRGIAAIQFKGSYHRSDIAQRGIAFLKQNTLSYANCGVDIVNGDKFIHDHVSSVVKATARAGSWRPNVKGFGGVFDLRSAGYTDPILVSGADGVGTKLMLAQMCERHTTIGIDLVAMCVNDIITHNAEPLYFLDYYACGKLHAEQAAQVVSGIGNGCRLAGCALIGGETAEMPGVYDHGCYDLGGFAVGAYDRGHHLPLPLIDDIMAGDVIIGLASSGVHSNGYSLVRKVVEKCNLNLHDLAPFDSTRLLGEVLLTPTMIYAQNLLPILRQHQGTIRAAAHITGGGLPGNLCRVLPQHLGASLDAACWAVHPVFAWLAREGNVTINEMLCTFNCGIGMCLVVAYDFTQQILAECCDHNLVATVIGTVVPRDSENEQSVMVNNFDKVLHDISTAQYNNANHDMNFHVQPIARTLSVPKKKIAVLISGSGTNLQSIIDFSRLQVDCSYQVQVVISNRASAQGIQRAQAAGISTMVIDHKKFKTRELFDQELDHQLSCNDIKLVCLAGFMRLLSGWFVTRWSRRVVNIHPSLLPSFKGMDAHKQALDAGVRITGCTVHFVTEGMDEGPIIAQQSVPVFPQTDTVEQLQARVKSVEHVLYPKALQELML